MTIRKKKEKKDKSVAYVQDCMKIKTNKLQKKKREKKSYAHYFTLPLTSSPVLLLRTKLAPPTITTTTTTTTVGWLVGNSALELELQFCY